MKITEILEEEDHNRNGHIKRNQLSNGAAGGSSVGSGVVQLAEPDRDVCFFAADLRDDHSWHNGAHGRNNHSAETESPSTQSLYPDGRWTSDHVSLRATVTNGSSSPAGRLLTSTTLRAMPAQLDSGRPRASVDKGKGAESNVSTSMSAASAAVPPCAEENESGARCTACSQDKCPGYFGHPWRAQCRYCKCELRAHDVRLAGANSAARRLGLQPAGSDPAGRKSSVGAANHNNNGAGAGVMAHAPGSAAYGYAWAPPGLTRTKVEEYMSQLDNHKVPRLNSAGEKHREKQLMIQLPRQDLAATYCKHLGGHAERRTYEHFINQRNENALDIGYVEPNLDKRLECRKCAGVLEQSDMAVMAPKFGADTAWHPACFTCDKCDELLVDLTYCVLESSVLCERHYADASKPRCAACDEVVLHGLRVAPGMSSCDTATLYCPVIGIEFVELPKENYTLIFAGEYTKAMNRDWHSDHFCCWQCDAALTGQRYILRDEHPYCIRCYEDVFANTCDECAKPIGIDSKDLSYKDKHWHEDCFLCSMCKISLVDKPFGSKNDRIFCANCYDQAFATRCDACGEIFKAGMKKMEYKGKQWHDACFTCALCKAPIGTRSFIPKNDEVYCGTCYEDKFATKCTKCKKVITTGGVTYKNEPWHRECFCCAHCAQSLAGQRFTSKDDRPYCAQCYGDLFAKRCAACSEPITGIGGTKFISFEDRHWHNECFACAQCRSTLVGKGFITDGPDILCPDCAKARLMAANA